VYVNTCNIHTLVAYKVSVDLRSFKDAVGALNDREFAASLLQIEACDIDLRLSHVVCFLFLCLVATCILILMLNNSASYVFGTVQGAQV
jgi:hypothetical protein